MSAKKVIIFDFDGVLLDSRDANFRSFKEVGVKLNPSVELTLKRFQEWYSPNFRHLYERMGIEPEDWPQANKIWREHYLSKENPKLFSHTVRVLSYLKSKRFKLGLVTGGSEERVSFELERKGIAVFFDVVVYGDSLSADEVKPAPNQLLIALEKLGANARDAAYVGDTTVDVLAGRSAGMQTIAVTTGFHSRKRIAESNPDVIIDDLEALERVF
jgi:HAD superfamily hydrolase (TIGR01549 family)